MGKKPTIKEKRKKRQWAKQELKKYSEESIEVVRWYRLQSSLIACKDKARLQKQLFDNYHFFSAVEWEMGDTEFVDILALLEIVEPSCKNYKRSPYCWPTDASDYFQNRGEFYFRKPD